MGEQSHDPLDEVEIVLEAYVSEFYKELRVVETDQASHEERGVLEV